MAWDHVTDPVGMDRTRSPAPANRRNGGPATMRSCANAHTRNANMRSSTAGGWVTGRVVRADLALAGGVRAERMRMVALPRLDSPLLGMDVLGRLHWQQRDGALRIDLGLTNSGSPPS